MSNSKKPKRNLYKEAFINQYNLILVMFAVVASLGAAAFDVSGWFLPIVAAIGLEMLYLTFIPETEFFKRAVEKKYREIDAESVQAKLDRRLNQLSWQQRNRYDSLSTVIESTKLNFNEQGAGLGDSMVAKLETLTDRVLWMMETENSYNRYLGSVDHRQLEADLQHVRSSIATADGRVKKSLEDRREVLEKRLNRLKRVYENLTVLSTQIATIEDIMRLIYESSMSMSDPQGISQQIDDLLIDVESTEETIAELEQVDDGGETDLAFDRKLEAALADLDDIIDQSDSDETTFGFDGDLESALDELDSVIEQSEVEEEHVGS